MSITVGLDFGTHQTKICVEDSTDPLNKTHRFITFKNKAGEETLFFPSIVQINKDNTVSYGFVDESDCKIVELPKKPKPKKADYVDEDITEPYDNLIEPRLILPERPKKIKKPEKPEKPQKSEKPPKPAEPIFGRRPSGMTKTCFKEICNKATKDYQEALIVYNEKNKEYKKRCDKYKIDLKLYNEKFDLALCNNKKADDDWDTRCTYVIERYKIEKEEYYYKLSVNKKLEQYNKAVLEWEGYPPILESLHYRYFKLPIFVPSASKWTHKISAYYISVWYIAYIILVLNEKYGKANYSIQIGLPVTYRADGAYRNKAYQLLFSAYDLAENKFSSLDVFCSTPYDELLRKTDLKPKFGREKIAAYGMMAIPEAYASLCAVTKQRRLRNGMQFLVDIGGGTTDISFFTITSSQQPNIHNIISMPIGLNFILEEISKSRKISLSNAHDDFRKNSSMYGKEIYLYRKKLEEYLINIKKKTVDVFMTRVARDHGDLHLLLDAFKGRPIIYCGGGGICNSLHIGLNEYFNDLKILDIGMLSVDTIINKIDGKLYPILSTAYGLSLEIVELPSLTPLDRMFDHIKLEERRRIEERNDDI